MGEVMVEVMLCLPREERRGEREREKGEEGEKRERWIRGSKGRGEPEQDETVREES